MLQPIVKNVSINFCSYAHSDSAPCICLPPYMSNVIIFILNSFLN